MPPDLVLVPYSMTTIVVALFAVSAVHLHSRIATTYAVWFWSVGALLILCSLNLGFAASTFLVSDKLTSHVVFHVVVSTLFAVIVTVGLPKFMIGIIPRERS